jgi:uncharacterized protein DUF1707
VVSEYQPSEIRISDSEREDALGKLNEHMTAGRLDIDEYGERSAKIVTAKTRGELLSLFGDLPEPKPAFGQPHPTAGLPPVRRERTFAEKFIPVAAPIAVIALVAGAFIAFHIYFFLPFLFIFLIASRGGGNRWQGGGRGRPRGTRYGRY